MINGLSHPVRARVLAILDQREASPKEIADLLGEKLSNVSYHVRVLRDSGLIELVGTSPRRGALEHHYRSISRPGAMVNVDLELDAKGWAKADAALVKLDKVIVGIAAQHSGDVHGRLVGLILTSPRP